jgi:hypothetical protein
MRDRSDQHRLEIAAQAIPIESRNQLAVDKAHMVLAPIGVPDYSYAGGSRLFSGSGSNLVDPLSAMGSGGKVAPPTNAMNSRRFICPPCSHGIAETLTIFIARRIGPLHRNTSTGVMAVAGHQEI